MQELISRYSLRKIIGIAVFAIILLGLPISLLVLRQRQDIRQHAAGDNTTYIVSAVSDAPGYNLLLLNQDKLIQILIRMGVFGSKYTFRNPHSSPTPPSETINSVTVHLVDEKTNGKDAIIPKIQSYLNFSDGNLNVMIVIPEKILSNDAIIHKGFLVQKELFIKLTSLFSPRSHLARNKLDLSSQLHSEAQNNELFFNITKQ